MTNKNAYAQSGVDVEAEVVEQIKSMWHVQSGLVSWEHWVALACLTYLRLGSREPVLISGTDGGRNQAHAGHSV